MISVEKTVVFHGKPTTPEERIVLKEAGFVHITGLGYANPREVGFPHLIGEELTPEKDYGKYGTSAQSGLDVIITTSGEVWLRAIMTEAEPLVSAIWKRFCPKGGLVDVPFSKRELFDIHDLLARIADPDHNLVYRK
jgi:hypothetical protein